MRPNLDSEMIIIIIEWNDEDDMIFEMKLVK